MNNEVEAMLEKSPRPLPYTVAILALLLAVIFTANVVPGIVLGFVAGSYFGNYLGRLAVMEAWRTQMHADHEARMASLDERYTEPLPPVPWDDEDEALAQ